MPEKLRVVADDAIPFLRGVLERFAAVTYLPGEAISSESVKEADALIVRTRTKCDSTLLEGSSVKFVSTVTVGVDHLDLPYLEAKGITWVNAAGTNSGSVAQYIAAALLEMCLERKVHPRELTLGIVGVGNVGAKVYKVAKLLGMKVLCSDPPLEAKGKCPDAVPYLELLAKADVITFHVPLIEEGKFRTLHMFDSYALEHMKPGAWLINSSRGQVVGSASLVLALQTGLAGGAILDVWELEPEISLQLMRRTFLSTMHIAGYSRDGKANATTASVRAFAKFFGIGELADFTAHPEERSIPFSLALPEGLSDVEQLARIFRVSYDIRKDSDQLRSNPGRFEYFRKFYWTRREAHAFYGTVSGASEWALECARGLGFHIG